jgi:5-methylcytosine-specific restriction endonuclease McrA
VRTANASAQKETLDIPAAVRRAVDQRDGSHCRVCGRFMGDARALHHIIYGGDERGTGGRRVHNVDEIVTVCWMFGSDCHSLVHSNKKLWQPLLLQVVQTPGTTAMQLKRWSERNRTKT